MTEKYQWEEATRAGIETAKLAFEPETAETHDEINEQRKEWLDLVEHWYRDFCAEHTFEIDFETVPSDPIKKLRRRAAVIFADDILPRL